MVDLRGNNGGELAEVSKVLGYFVARGTHLYSTRGRAADSSAEHAATGPNLMPNVTVAVLVDRSTRNGGELAALALRQLRGALLIGEPTAGINSIETTYRMRNGWFAVITVAAWISPGGSGISEAGVLPDIVVESSHNVEYDVTDPAIALAFAALLK